MTIELILLWAAVLTGISVVASKISTRFALPSLLLFIFIGMLAGNEGPGGIYFDDYDLAKSIGTIALVFIIYSGGLDTAWKKVKPLFYPGIILSSAGVLLTAIIVAVFSVSLLKISPLEGLLLGSIVSSTDAAAVFSILRSRKISLKGGLRPLLELESGSNDPMAVFLTMTCIGLLTRKIAFGPELLMMFILNMGIGLLIGFIMAKVSITLINRIKLEYEGLYPVLTIALILYTYAITTLANGNGFLAVYLLGLLMSKDVFVQKRSIVRFYEGIAWLMQIIMFLTLGLLVFPSRIVPVIGPGLLIACILIFLARPTAVFLSLMPFKFSLPEKTMIAWVGLRGAVPIILATFPLLAGIEEAQTIFNIVFFVVLTSVLVQGTSVPVLSKWLKVTSPLDEKKRYPIEFEHSHGINATLTDIIIPFNSAVVGRTIAQLNIPPNTLIVLISRGEEFLVPNGSTLLEEGDVLLVLANDEDLRQIQSEVKVFKPEEK